MVNSTCLKNRRRHKNGTFLPDPPPTPAEIARMISHLKRIMIPEGLKLEWRKWPLSKRAAFISRLRRKLNIPGSRPQTPFSKNVTPFHYGSPHAHALADKLNARTNSRNARVKIKLASQGLIFRDRLFFWDQGKNIGYQEGPYTPGEGRKSLHHVIWEDHNGRPVPEHTTVIFLDGNKNNFTPRNLGLRTRADCARMNKSNGLIAKANQNLSSALSTYNAKTK